MNEQISFDDFLKESLPQTHPEYDINDAAMEARERFRTSPGIDDEFAELLDFLLNMLGAYIIGPAARKILKHQIPERIDLYVPWGKSLTTKAIEEWCKSKHHFWIEDGRIVPASLYLPIFTLVLHTEMCVEEIGRVDLDLIWISRTGVQTHMFNSIQSILDTQARAAAWEYIPMAELTEEEAIELAVDGFTCRPIPTL